MFGRDYVPVLPFEGFKWRWATSTCTEGINDPIVLLGILSRMRHLELQDRGIKFNSDEFGLELNRLADDIENSKNCCGTSVNLRGRGGNRNILRNSRQYWTALGLLPLSPRTKGIIELSPFGRAVADHDISQADFAAVTIQTFRLPNPATYNQDELERWRIRQLEFYPLKLLLQIIQQLAHSDADQGYITVDELIRIIIPLSSQRAEVEEYVQYIIWYRNGEIEHIEDWPQCNPRSNDGRIAREYLLFLSNYGYVDRADDGTVNRHERYNFIPALDEAITKILNQPECDIPISYGNKNDIDNAVRNIQAVSSSVEHVRYQARQARPNQARFRREVLRASNGCIITHVQMPEVLEAAHIRPFAYNGEDVVGNGFAMRSDIHTLFDTGNLRISPNGDVFLTDRARMNYGYTIPEHIVVPDYVNREFLRWRWDNYNVV